MKPQSSSVRAGPSSIQLPRTLGRPPISDVSRAALLAASPDLGDLSVDDIRKSLLENASQMLASTSALSPSHLPAALPKDCLPSYLTVPVLPDRHCPSPSYPTHILAVSTARASASASTSSPTAATDIHLIFPIHAPILAAHCSKLPVLPPRAAASTPRARPDMSAAPSVHLPVLPLALPSAPAFAVLLGWMYTRRLGAVLSALLAFPASDPFLRRLELTLTPKAVRAALASRSDRHALAAHVCAAAAGDVTALMTHTAHVKELWQDMVALGIDDDALWDTLQLAYEIVLGALNLAVRPK